MNTHNSNNPPLYRAAYGNKERQEAAAKRAATIHRKRAEKATVARAEWEKHEAYIRALRAQRDELHHVLTVISDDPLPRYSRDPVSNLPIRDMIMDALRKEKV